ncbi:MAG TPA: gephyrin-like molybdotransferase Glp [Acidothermaceae bacterium]|jgi:molybdopterin molybdotransferase|nr:gephyrin-like molybdotransferase Glp [Acidothermaceae bacterium]
MRTVDEHLTAVLGTLGPLPPLDVNLLDAHGCVLAEDVVATRPLPSFDNSQMDGYAVRSVDVASATPQTPVVLPVIGDIAAGSGGVYSVNNGLSVRIMTGAPIPAGADCVIPVEWTDGGVARVRIDRAPSPGLFIRRTGEDVSANETVLTKGTALGATQIGLLAAIGRARVMVRPRPRVVIFSTGNELVDVGVEPGPAQISESNSYALTAAAREAGAIAYRVGIVPDDPTKLMAMIEDQLVRADLVVTTGGVSAGAYDTVKAVLSRLGTVEFLKVAMQPGMPQGFGTVGPDSTPIFTLPGNPVSAYVSFEVFVRPAIRRMLGVLPLYRPLVRATLAGPISKPAGKRSYVRARIEVTEGVYVVTPVGGMGSHLVADLAMANAFVVAPDTVTEIPAGSTVSVMMLERRQS